MTELDLSWVENTEKSCYKFPWTKAGFTKVLDNGLGYVFCDIESNKLGYACYLSVLDEIHLLNIAIKPEYQQQGVAKQSLIAMQEHFKNLNFKIMLLEVRESNPVIKLYENLGFKQDGVRKNYYPLAEAQKENAKLMTYII